MAVGWAVLLSCGRGLDALTLGEETAASLGIRVGRLRVLVVAGTALALFFDLHLKGMWFVRGVLILPMLLTPIVVGLMWRALLNPEWGMVNWVLGLFGLPQPQQQGPAAGVYPFARTDSDPPARLHLRVDPDGGGLLWANASEAAVLSPVGVVMAYGMLSGLDDVAIAAQVRARFHGADPARVDEDLAQMRALLAGLTTPDAGFPVSKPELSAFFRQADHRNYRACGDQILRNFLKGLTLMVRAA